MDILAVQDAGGRFVFIVKFAGDKFLILTVSNGNILRTNCKKEIKTPNILD